MTQIEATLKLRINELIDHLTHGNIHPITAKEEILKTVKALTIPVVNRSLNKNKTPTIEEFTNDLFVEVTVNSYLRKNDYKIYGLREITDEYNERFEKV